MKIFKPFWVNHDDQPIFSIDVHPDSSRFATGGQGQDSGKIIIWNMAPVIDANKENDENSPKILCQMDHHIACVNVVRWSNNGLFLASGSDDKLIMIWQYVHGGGNYQNIENWKCGFTLRGHSGDVLDLSWSSKDQYLASCSVDNTVIIWNALKFPDIIHRINAHAGLVKGVAWDPVGTFFASQSDDKTLKIWKTLDWSLEKAIDGPFKQCTGTTHVLRLNWSPDGQLVISAHAINNGVPTAQVIDRNKWSTKLDFVGHRKAVTTVRFFPQILKPCDASVTNFKTHCLCALGSRDRSISIWLTNYSRPLCVIHDSFDNPIMDLSWSKNPNPGLLACSMDGTVSYIEFDYKEVGKPLTREETSEFFMKKYNYDINTSIVLKNVSGQQFNAEINNADQKASQIKESAKFIENFDILLAQEQKQKQNFQHQQSLSQNSIQNENSMNSSIQNYNTNSQSTMTPSKQQMLIENHKQIERRMPDGRRRITPICVCKPGDFDTPMPFGSLNSFNKLGFASSLGFGGQSSDRSIISKTATEQSTIIIEKRDEKDEVVEVSPIKSIIYTKPTNFNTNSNSNDAKVAVSVAAQSITLEISKTNPSQNATTNLKSIPESMDTSILKTDSSSKINVQNQPQSQSAQINKSKIVSLKPNEQSIKAINTTLSASTSSTNVISAKQNQKPSITKPSIPTVNPSIIQNKTSNDLSNSKTPVTKISTPQKANLTESQRSQQHHHNNHNSDAQNFHFLKPLEAITDKNLVKIIKREKPIELIKIQNSISLIEKANLNQFQSNSEIEHNLSCIKYLKNDLIKWQVYFYSRLCEVACNRNLISCVCEDSTIHFFKPLNGTQICCPIVLDSRPVVLKSNANYCMCMTSSGHMYVWKYIQDTYNQEKNKSSYANINQPYEADTLNIATIINNESCQFILRNGDWLDCEITDNGVPIINMSKNRSYYFSLKTKCWHLLPCIGTLIGDGSQLHLNSNTIFANSMQLSQNNQSKQDHVSGPLSQIQSRNKSSSILKTIETINKCTSTSLFSKQDFTLTHLESQVNASIGLNSAKEYKFWLMTLVRYLVENNYEDKLTEVCNFLLGPLYSSNWSQTFLTYNKRDLLKEIILIIAENLNLQRLYSFYKQQLNLISNLSGKTSILERLVSSNRQDAGNKDSFRSISKPNMSLNVENIVNESENSTKIDSTSKNLIEIENKAEMNVDIEEDQAYLAIKSTQTMQENGDIFKMPEIPTKQEIATKTLSTTEYVQTDNNSIMENIEDDKKSEINEISNSNNAEPLLTPSLSLSPTSKVLANELALVNDAMDQQI